MSNHFSGELEQNALADELIKRISKIHDIFPLEGCDEKACLSSIGTRWEPYMSPLARLGCANTLTQLNALSWAGFAKVRDQIFTILAKEAYTPLRMEVAGNPNCPPNTLLELAKDPNEYVRASVAGNSICPPEILKTLAKDQYDEVRKSVASNANCPLDSLIKLAKDKDVFVQAAVAKNPHCPPEALEKLAEHEFKSVRISVAENPNSPAEVIAKLDKTSDFYKSLRVSLDPKISTELIVKLIENGNRRVIENIARNPKCPPELLIKLTKYGGDVYSNLAKNPNCPPELLFKLSEDVSNNPNCLPDLKYLRSYVLDEIKLNVAKNPNCPPELLAILGQNENDILRWVLAAHPQCQIEILTKWAGSDDKYTRLSVAGNPSCPTDLLVKLAHESFYAIRIAAIANPSYPADRQEADAEELSAYMLSWFDESRKKPTYEFTTEELMELSEILGTKPQVKVCFTPQKRLTTLKLNKSNHLIGNYPKILDLRNYEYELPNIFIHFDDEYKRAIKEGRPPQASIHISGKKSVEVIYLHSDKIGHDYGVIEDLPNLKELHVCRTENASYGHDELKWLICRNLPELKTITVEGSIFWLQLEDLTSLESIDASKCHTLDYFSIKNAPSLKKVNVKNCKKLRKILDLPDEVQNKLGIEKQIRQNQSKSKNNGTLYKNMTFTDVDTVMANINYGVKLATQQDLLNEDVENDAYFGRENDPECRPFSFHLLRPLENVNTGGTGETCAYESLNHSYTLGQHEVCWGMGNPNQQACIEYALSSIDGLKIPGIKNPSDNQILNFLNKLIVEENGAESTKML